MKNCDCKIGLDLCSYDGKDQTVVEVPDSIDLRYNAPDRQKRESVVIDTCLVPEIKWLWSKGVKTAGCCCGHEVDKSHASILVEQESISKMKELGYESWTNPMNPDRKDGFKPKTIVDGKEFNHAN